MELVKIMKKQSKKYENLIKKIQKNIDSCPEGTLNCKKEGNYYKWYQYILSKNARKYLPKSEEKTAILLAKKTLDLRRIQDMKHEKYAIDLYLKHHKEKQLAETFLEKANDEMRRLIGMSYKTMPEKYIKWQNEPFTVNPVNPESRKIRTLRGDLVRSKSEAMIADYLYLHHIPYRYECEMRFGDKVYYPDFIIINPLTGEMYIIEHFGMVDNEEYFSHALEKVKMYAQHKYYPEQNLICFFETSEHPLDSATIAQKFNCLLNLE